MSQSVFCQNCLTKTDVMDQVGRILSSSDKNKVELKDLKVSCCDNPALLWISSKELEDTPHNITPEEVEKRIEPATEESKS